MIVQNRGSGIVDGIEKYMKTKVLALGSRIKEIQTKGASLNCEQKMPRTNQGRRGSTTKQTEAGKVEVERYVLSKSMTA
jgi:hypothetical protein